MKKHIFLWGLSLYASLSQAQMAQIQVPVTVKELPAAVKAVQVICTLADANTGVQGVNHAPLVNGRFQGFISVDIPLPREVQDVRSYERLYCELRLCRSSVPTGSCATPLSTANNRWDQYRLYDTSAYSRLEGFLSMQDDGGQQVRVMPVSTRVLKGSTAKKMKGKQPATVKTVAAPPKKPAATESDNSAKKRKIIGLLNLPSELQDSDLTFEQINDMAGVISNANGNLSDSASWEVVKEKGVEEAKKAAFIDILNLPEDLKGSDLTLAEISEVAAIVAVTSEDNIDTDAWDVVLENGFEKGLLKVTADGFGMEVNTDDFKNAKELLKVAELIAATGANPQEADPKQWEDAKKVTDGKMPIEEYLVNNGVGIDPDPGTSRTPKPSAGNGKGKETTPSDSVIVESSGVGDDRTGGRAGSPAEASQNSDVYTLIGRGTSADGNPIVVWTVTGPDGSEATYTTEFYDDGTYQVMDSSGDYVAEGVGVPPKPSVQPGDTTTTVAGEEAIFQADEKEDDNAEGGSGDGEENTNNNDENDGEGDDGNSGCSQEGGNCDNESDDSGEESDSADTDAADSGSEGTPDPRDNESNSEGIAWALANPGNPLAQNILSSAADAIELKSGRCQVGCADATEKGGVLWALRNPANPVARAILAAVAASIAENSGNGQVGGTDDNPSIDVENTASAEAIELLVEGGGVVDPVDEGASGGGGLVGPPPVTGTGPVPGEIQIRGGHVGGAPPSTGGDEPESPGGTLNIDTGRLSEGVNR